MEYRKLISFGNSSYVVSLPKQWLERHGLKKGDTLYLEFNGSNIILHTSETSAERDKVETVINVDGLREEVIRQMIQGAYINNTHVIRVKGKELPQKTRKVKEIFQNLVAMEVVEQDTKSIVAKSFLDIKDVDVDSIIRKTDHIVKTMLEDLKEVCRKPVLEAVEISDNITQRDEDVNKMTFLIFRSLNNTMNNGFWQDPQRDMLSMWGFNFFLEEIGDEVKRIARIAAKMETPELIEEYTALIDEVAENYSEIMKGFYSNDQELVYSVAAERNELIQRCDDLLQKHMSPIMVALIDKTQHLVDKIHNLNTISTMSGIMSMA